LIEKDTTPREWITASGRPVRTSLNVPRQGSRYERLPMRTSSESPTSATESISVAGMFVTTFPYGSSM
jgi:hypothetical protein